MAAGINRYYVSLDSSATVPGIAGTVADEDLIVYDRATSTWAMYFDASDVGISTSDLEDFAVRADGSVLMSFSSAFNVPGLTGGPDGTLVDDSDIVLFTPTSTGTTTAGAFSFYFDGSDVGLESTSELLDGIHELVDGTTTRLLLSTTGTASGAGLAGDDEDVLLFTPTALGSITAGTFSTHFDGSDVGLTSGNDDLDAISVDTNGDLLYSTSGDNTVPGTLNEDINRFTGTYGATTTGSALLQLALAPLGIATTNNLDGLQTRADGDAGGSGPVAGDDSATTSEDTAVTVDVAANDTDPDGNLNPASVTITVPAANGTATPNGTGGITYTPAANFNGTNIFTYRICDTTSLCATAAVTDHRDGRRRPAGCCGRPGFHRRGDGRDRRRGRQRLGPGRRPGPGWRHRHHGAGQRHRHPQRERHGHLPARQWPQRHRHLHVSHLRHHRPLRDGRRHRHRRRHRPLLRLTRQQRHGRRRRQRPRRGPHRLRPGGRRLVVVLRRLRRGHQHQRPRGLPRPRRRQHPHVVL